MTLAHLSKGTVYLTIRLDCRNQDTLTWDLTPGRLVSLLRIGITILLEVCLAFAIAYVAG